MLEKHNVNATKLSLPFLALKQSYRNFLSINFDKQFTEATIYRSIFPYIAHNRR